MKFAAVPRPQVSLRSLLLLVTVAAVACGIWRGFEHWRKTRLSYLDEQFKQAVAQEDYEAAHRLMRLTAELYPDEPDTVRDTRLVYLVDRFRKMLDERNYKQAYRLAKLAGQLYPEEAVVETMVWQSGFVLGIFDWSSYQSTGAMVNPDEGTAIDESAWLPPVPGWDELTRIRQDGPCGVFWHQHDPSGNEGTSFVETR